MTIEFKGDVQPGLAALIEDWVFGCDVCQDVCPWNEKFATRDEDATLGHDPSLAVLDLDWLSDIDEEEFQRALGWTAMERTGSAGMRRNADLVKSNSEKESPCRTSSKQSRTQRSVRG